MAYIATIKGKLRYRVVNIITGAEITNDLPHLGSSWTINAMRPGDPASNWLGSSHIDLHPPGSRAYKKARYIYDQLDYWQRIEGYLSHTGASIGGAPKFAGPILGLPRSHGGNNSFAITGQTDLAWAAKSQPFPGELLSNLTTDAMLKAYMGTNEPGSGNDVFNPFTAGNYTSTNFPSNTSGAWSGTTDDGFPVVSCATGTGAVLIAKSGGAANDGAHSQYVEVSGRLKPSADTANAGKFGVTVSKSGTSISNSAAAYVTARKLPGGRYAIDVSALTVTGGVGGNALTIFTALTNVDDPQGYIPLVVGLLCSNGGNSGNATQLTVTVNGQVVISQLASAYDPGTGTNFPGLVYGTPASGAATGYFNRVRQLTRFTPDGASTASMFGLGSIPASTDSLPFGIAPSQNFLEQWARLAVRDGRYLRYTPQAFRAGTRTLGTLDFAADPGTDYGTTKQVVYASPGNLAQLDLPGNADPFTSSTHLVSQASLDGGGVAIWADVGSETKYGVISDQTLAFEHADYGSQRRAAYQIVANKIALSTAGAKVGTVLRDLRTADVARELDKVMIDDPEMGINKLVARIVSYGFSEGDRLQPMLFDQFAEE